MNKITFKITKQFREQKRLSQQCTAKTQTSCDGCALDSADYTLFSSSLRRSGKL
jgi:hypothetical protein